MSTIGRPRKLTDAQVKRLREWKPFRELAKELGISPKTACWARRHHYKRPSP